MVYPTEHYDRAASQVQATQNYIPYSHSDGTSLQEEFGKDYWNYSSGYLPRSSHSRFTETSSRSQPQTTASLPLNGNISSSCSMTTLLFLHRTTCASLLVHELSNSGTPLSRRQPNYHPISLLKDTLGFVVGTLIIMLRRESFLSEESKTTLKWILTSLLPLLSSIPLNCFCSLTINAAADAFATQDSIGIGGWVATPSTTYWFMVYT